MTPAARISAAIEILDRVLGGTPIEPALTAWGRGNRFAGSGDRAAIRDLVFDAWRCKRSFAALGGGDSGRGLMLGRLRALGQDEGELFTGEAHAPALPTPLDVRRNATENEALNCPDWLAPRLQHSLGDQFVPIMRALQQRAPVFLRVNLARTTRAAATELLADDGIDTAPHPMAEASLGVLTPTRKLMTTLAYLDGLVELQDVASQAIVEAIPLTADQKVLDYCAGGGGKTLALAARAALKLWAHDANPARMRDLPERAKRAGAAITISTDPRQHAPYDVVLVDAPCSGSGSWRRDPQGKWALTDARLTELIEIQAETLVKTAPLVAQDGLLVYATCSLLSDENQAQIAHFLHNHPDWHQTLQRIFTPLDGGDGFFISILRRMT
jgi:16S rRNA (cytosine967-C5)-methyltransferase